MARLVTGATISLLVACEVHFKLLSIVIKGKCGVVSQSSHDSLFGINFLARAPLVLNLKHLFFSNPFFSNQFFSPTLGCSLSAKTKPVFYGTAVNKRSATPGFLQIVEIKQEAAVVHTAFELDRT